MTIEPTVEPPAAQGMARSFLALGAGETLARLVAFGATVWMARRLGAGAYGVVALASAILLYFNYIADFGADAVGVPRVARAPARVGITVPSLLLARLAIGAGLWVVLAAVGLLLLPQPEGAVLAALALVLPLRGANVRWALIGLERSGTVGAARVLGEALSAVLVVSFVRHTGQLGSVPVAQVAGDAVAALALLVALRRLGVALPIAVDRAEVRGALRDGWPLVLHAILAMLAFNADLVILRFFRDAATVGRYAVAYTLVSYLANLGSAFAVSALPALSRAGAADGRDYRTAMAYAAAIAVPAALGGWVLSGPIIGMIFGADYAPAGAALAVLIWNVPALWLRFTGQMGLIAAGRQDVVLRVTVIGAVVAIGLDLLIVPRYGMLGAAGVAVGVETLRFVLVLVLGARAGLPSPGLPRIWRIVVASVVMAVAVRALAGAPVIVGVAAGAVVYAAALTLLGGVRWRRGAWPQLVT